MTGLIITERRPFQRFSLALGGAQLVVPSLCDARAGLLKSSNQGSTSQCVAYSMAGWIEYWNWKLDGTTEQISASDIYRRAKQIDGLGGGDGTTLEAGFQAARDLGFISSLQAVNVREIYEPADAMRALHRYDVMLCAFLITENWFNAEPDGWIQPGGKRVGGHAVLGCYYSLADNSFGFQNSWGEGQGWRGFNRIKFDTFKEQFQYGLVWG